MPAEPLPRACPFQTSGDIGQHEPNRGTIGFPTSTRHKLRRDSAPLGVCQLTIINLSSPQLCWILICSLSTSFFFDIVYRAYTYTYTRLTPHPIFHFNFVVSNKDLYPYTNTPNQLKMSQSFTKSQVAEHKDEKSMYIIIDDGVYDITSMFTLSPLFLPSLYFPRGLFTAAPDPLRSPRRNHLYQLTTPTRQQETLNQELHS